MASTLEVNQASAQFFGAAPQRRKSELDMSTFLRLLTVQLANQNPLEPMSDRDFFAQLAQLGQVQGTDKMSKQLETLQASALIGKTVRAFISRVPGQPGEDIVGRVVGLDVINGEQILKVQEPNGGLVDVKFENVQSFTDIQTVQPPVPTLADASTLIGREVRATIGSGDNQQDIYGPVVRASMVNGVPMVTIHSEAGMIQVPYLQVQEVLS